MARFNLPIPPKLPTGGGRSPGVNLPPPPVGYTDAYGVVPPLPPETGGIKDLSYEQWTQRNTEVPIEKPWWDQPGGPFAKNKGGQIGNSAQAEKDKANRQYEDATGDDLWWKLGGLGALLMSFSPRTAGQATGVAALADSESKKRQRARAMALLDSPYKQYLSDVQRMGALGQAGFNPNAIETANQYDQMDGGGDGQLYTGGRDATGTKQRTSDPVAMVSNMAQDDVPGALALAGKLFAAGRISGRQLEDFYDTYAGLPYESTSASTPNEPDRPLYAGDLKALERAEKIKGDKATTRKTLYEGDKSFGEAVKALADNIARSDLTTEQIEIALSKENNGQMIAALFPDQDPNVVWRAMRMVASSRQGI